MRRILLATMVLVALQVPAAAGAGNEPPLPDAGLDQHVDTGATVLLDATGSRDPDGQVRGYEWVVETPAGSTVQPACPTCPRTNFVADQPGRYDVTIRVTDDDGAVRTDTLYVYVEGNGSPPSDDESTPTPDPDPPEPDGDSGPSESVRDGSPEVGASSDAGGWEAPPAFSIHCPDRVAVGESVTCSADTARLETPLAFSWSNGASGPSATYAWTSPGSKTVVASVEDAGGTTLSDQATVRVVGNEPPRVQIAIPGSLAPGESVGLSTSVKEDPDGRIVATVWGPGQSVTVPKDDSSVIVSILVRDNDGATATDSITLTGEVNKESGVETEVNACYQVADDRGSCAMGGTYIPNPASDPRLTDEQEEMVGGVETVTEHVAERSARVADQLQPYTLNGKTVSSDLTGDGEINAADWDERYASATDDSTAGSANPIQDVKETQRKYRQTTQSAESNENTWDNTESEQSDEESGSPGRYPGGMTEEKAEQLADPF